MYHSLGSCHRILQYTSILHTTILHTTILQHTTIYYNILQHTTILQLQHTTILQYYIQKSENQTQYLILHSLKYFEKNKI